MTDNDQLLRFTFENSDVRGEIARVQKSLTQVLLKHDYPIAIQNLLAEMVTAAVLLSATIKFDGQLIIQANGSGPITTLMVESSNNQEIRGIARYDENAEINPEEKDLTKLLGKAVLAITINPTKGERYQGIVPLEDGSLSRCLETYFRQSEQLETKIWLATDLNADKTCTGFLLQQLPGDASKDWGHLTHLAATLKDDELNHLEFKDILHRLYHQDPVKVHQSTDIQFHCSCSRARTTQALISLGSTELKSLSDEQEEVSIDCQFCNQIYLYDQVDIGELISQTKGN